MYYLFGRKRMLNLGLIFLYVIQLLTVNNYNYSSDEVNINHFHQH